VKCFGYVLTLVLCSACATRQVATWTPQLVESVEHAEAYVARHGYTVAGHPEAEPVERVEIMDMIYSDAELVQSRRATLEPFAFGVSAVEDGWYVLFRPVHKTRGDRAVLVTHGEPVQVVHANFNFKSRSWQLLPSNRWQERSRDR
jgi:hypothetical protein